jgi:hypothetical protein
MSEKTKGQWQIDENEYVTWQKVVDCPDLNKTELYSRTLDYFLHNYADVNSVIQDRDIVNGVIIGKGIYKKVNVLNNVLQSNSVDTWHLLKVQVKDGRAKITLSLTQYEETVRGRELPDVHYLYPVIKQFPFNPAGYQKDLYKQAFNKSHLKALETIASVEKALKGESIQNKSANW